MLIVAVLVLLAAGILSVTRHARWWPLVACVGLALFALAHGVHIDLD